MTTYTIELTSTDVRTLRHDLEATQAAQLKRDAWLASRPTTRARNARRTLATEMRRTAVLLDKVHPIAAAIDAATIAQLRSEAGVQ